MELGRPYCRALGLGVCGLSIAVAALAPHGDSAASALIEVGHVAGPEGSSGQEATAPDGSLAATVSWPGAAGLDAVDICVVVFDAEGGVVRGDGDVVAPVPGQPVAARWTVSGLDEGSYTLLVAQCPSPAADVRRRVEPQYLGGGAESDAAWWIQVTEGAQVDVGTIALHPAALETWPQRS